MLKNEIKFSILMCFMGEGIAFPQTIRMVLSDNPCVGSYISKLTREGYIKNRSIVIRYNKRKQNITYKSITQKGVQWLVDNYSDTDSYIKYLPNPVPSFRTAQIANSENLYRHLKSLSASLVFRSIGIRTEKGNKGDNTSEVVYLNDLVRGAKNKYTNAQDKYENGNIIANNNAPTSVYYHSRDIKDGFQLNEKEINQYNFSTHIGLLVSRCRSYLIYSPKANGMVFRHNTVERAQLSAFSLLRSKGFYDELNTGTTKGIVFCRNNREFEETFNRNNEGIGQDRDVFADRRLSNVFTHLYAIPLNTANLNVLRDILYYGDTLHDELIQILLSSNLGFEDGISVTFELRYQGRDVFIGIDMNMTKIQYLHREVVYGNRDGGITVMCYPHQRDCYERILPEGSVEYYMVEKNILKNK